MVFLFVVDCCFIVQVVKNERGLGISVYGGIDTNVPFRGLIRIKRIFPNQSAWSTGMLQLGDILLEANGVKLTGLTNHVRFSHNSWLKMLYSVIHFIHSHFLFSNRRHLKFCERHRKFYF